MRAFAIILVAFSVVATPVARADAPPPGVRFVFPAAGTIACGYVGLCPGDPPSVLSSRLGDECYAPPPSVASVDSVPAPEIPQDKKMILELTIFPDVDWDPYLCDDAGHSYFPSPYLVGELCDHETLPPDNPVPIGCIEQVSMPVHHGQVVHVHAFNRADVTDCPAVYQWVIV